MSRATLKVTPRFFLYRWNTNQFVQWTGGRPMMSDAFGWITEEMLDEAACALDVALNAEAAR